MRDIEQTLISQYATSPAISALVKSINEWIRPDVDLDNFYNLIWNIETAEGYGLDVWGRIVGVVRVLTVVSGQFFGFAEASDPSEVGTFGQAPLYSGSSVTSNFALTDDAFRKLILAKAAANITNGSIQSINRILMGLFPGRGNCYVLDNLDMTMTYKFEFALEPFEISIVEQSGVLPRSVGVAANASFL